MSSLSVLCLQCTSSQGGGKKKPWVSTFQDVFSGQNVLEPICELESKAWPGEEVADKNRE